MNHKYYTDKEIEQKVRTLQKELWELAGCPKDTKKILEAFEPSKVIEYLNYNYVEVENLGDNRFNNKNYATAGIIDHERKLISISKMFKPTIKRFTTGHEVGHLELHPNQSGLHRDIPVDYSKSEIKDHREREANKFSTFLLMPEKLVLNEIINMLRKLGGYEAFISHNPTNIAKETTRIHFDENLSFWLTTDSMKLVSASKENLERESAIASFRNGSFSSLAEIFKVSHTAMTYRIKELGIIIYP